MAKLIQNITDTSGDYIFPTPDGGTVQGIDLYVADIPNLATIKWRPGQIIDLELYATIEQIDKSNHLRKHIQEGRMAEV